MIPACLVGRNSSHPCRLASRTKTGSTASPSSSWGLKLSVWVVRPWPFVGNRQVPALSTDQFGRKSWSPGYEVGLGYKFDSGLAVSVRFGQLTQIKYSAGAAGASPPLGLARPDLSDTFLYSPVFNFPPAYSGPDAETDLDITGQNPSGNFYGIWNGASVMDIQYDQRFTYGEIAARVPLFQTDYSRVYGFGGARYAWFFERFYWRTVAQDILGRSFPQDVAIYTNTLSQRMYGPMLGCGHEVYMGKRFAIGLDLSTAALMNIAKQRAKYKLGDDSTQAKRSRNEFEIVPNINTDLSLMWYPIEGVQVKVGYSFQSYFNTRYMAEPIAFDFGAMDPEYRTRGFRYVSVFNLGIGFFF
jgi:Legionella pneumophila major outer membrane protein precursor